MRGIYFDGKELTYREDLEKPILTANHSIIEITHAALCSTDKQIIKGYKPDFKGVLGHEFVGVVVESEDANLIGKRVVAEINEGCGDCYYCNNNLEKHCLKRKVTGIHNHWGAFTEYLEVANHLIYPVPDNLSSEKAVYTEPLAAALEITDCVHIKPSDKVAIIGDGRLSYMIVQVVALTGAEIYLIGKHEEKLKNFKPFATTMTKAEGSYDFVIDATGSPSGIETAKKILRRRGTLLMKSTYAQQLTTDFSYFVVNEITIIGTRCGPFAPALKLLAKNKITLPEIKYYDLKDYKKAFTDSGFKIGFRL